MDEATRRETAKSEVAEIVSSVFDGTSGPKAGLFVAATIPGEGKDRITVKSFGHKLSLKAAAAVVRDVAIAMAVAQIRKTYILAWEDADLTAELLAQASSELTDAVTEGIKDGQKICEEEAESLGLKYRE